MLINKEFLKSLKPCRDRWANYLNHYSEWEGSFLEFLELEKISSEDKIWVFSREGLFPEEIHREFAIICASRAVDNTEIEEIKEFMILILFQFEAGILPKEKNAADRAAYWAAYWAADRAADSAAYWAACWAACWAADRAAYSAADRAAESAADRAADSAAYGAAYGAADRAAERDVQVEIIKNLMEGVDE